MKKILVILILAMSISLFAQTYDFTLTVTPPLHKTYHVLYPANFNPDEPEMQPSLFTVGINGPTSMNAVLYCRMVWEDEEATMTLTPNTPGQFPTLLNSIDIINSVPGGFTTVQNFDDFLDNIEDLIMNTGRMPDGNYIFNIGIYEEGHQGEEAYLLSNPVTAIVTIRSPISISLITPGNPIGLGVTNITEQYPNFIWFSNLESYTFKCYELDRIYDSVDEIEMLEPYYTESDIAVTSYSYPPRAPGFEYNKTYAWQIIARTMNPIMASESEYKSTIYLFKLSDTASDESGLQNLINFFNQLDIEGVGELINLLEVGYTIDKINWQNNDIKVEDLMHILESISSGNITPTKITVE